MCRSWLRATTAACSWWKLCGADAFELEANLKSATPGRSTVRDCRAYLYHGVAVRWYREAEQHGATNWDFPLADGSESPARQVERLDSIAVVRTAARRNHHDIDSSSEWHPSVAARGRWCCVREFNREAASPIMMTDHHDRFSTHSLGLPTLYAHCDADVSSRTYRYRVIERHDSDTPIEPDNFASQQSDAINVQLCPAALNSGLCRSREDWFRRHPKKGHAGGGRSAGLAR